MATITEMQQALSELINSEGFDIPGLDKESVLSNYVEIKHKNELDEIEDEEEREKEKKRLIELYENTAGNFFDYCIMQIKLKYQAIVEGCEQMVQSISSAISSTVIPSVLTVGTATSTANPAYTALENQQKKNNFKAILKNLSLMMADLLQMAINILFVVPDAVISLIETLTTTKQVIETIP